MEKTCHVYKIHNFKCLIEQLNKCYHPARGGQYSKLKLQPYPKMHVPGIFKYASTLNSAWVELESRDIREVRLRGTARTASSSVPKDLCSARAADRAYAEGMAQPSREVAEQSKQSFFKYRSR